jgi:Zn-dependent protease with chaperone function
MANASGAAGAPPRYGVQLSEQILAGFRGTIPSVRPALSYRLNLLVVTVVMVLLPLVYLALIGGVIWGAAWYATHAWSVLLGGLLAIKLRLLLYVAPLAVAGILVVFMIKPLFARPAQAARPLRLTRNQEPILFDFVERLCKVVGAPVPKEIHVDCQVNASASFRRGLVSLLGSDLVLTIGLPLVAGLSLRQLAGVLAHEFGHFGQRAGMRLTYLVRTLNGWFYRLVYERDSLDAQLQEAAKESDRLALIWGLAILCVGLSRKILQGLMMAGHAVSSSMMRQMEFDADRYEARLVGSRVFESTVRDLICLGAAYQQSLSDLSGLWQEGRLADSLPHLVAANHQRLAPQIAGEVEHHLASGKTRLFDTHPADRDRIANAARERGDGIFSSDLPARALFRDFSSLEKSVSYAFYREVLGDDLKPQDLVPTHEALERKNQVDEDREALVRRFPETLSLLRPLPLPDLLPHLDAAVAAGDLAEARRVVSRQRDDHVLHLKRYQNADELLAKSQLAQALLDAGLPVKPGDFELTRVDEAALAQARQRAEARLADLDPVLDGYEKAEVRRLTLALALNAAGTGVGAAGGASRPEAERLLACAATVSRLLPRLHELRQLHSHLGLLWSKVGDNSQNARLVRRVEEMMGEAHGTLEGLWTTLRSQPYPFDHAHGEVTLAEMTLPAVPAPSNLPALYQASGQVVEALFDLYIRVLGRLARIAEPAEAAAGG